MTRNAKDADPVRPHRRPASTPEARENQLISSAIDLAEKQILDGTASAQVITHYLKLGTTSEKMQREKLKYETELIKAKAQEIEANSRSEELQAEAIRVFTGYQGKESPDEADFYEA